MSLIFGLVVAALMLIFFEVLLPGGILGILAAILIIVATWLGFADFGALGGVITFLGALLASGLLVYFEFKWMANSGYGKRFFLKSTVSGHSNKAQGDASIIGKEAKTVTRLNPSGKVAVDGQAFEAHSQDGYIDAGQSVVVAGQDNFKLIIKKP